MVVLDATVMNIALPSAQNALHFNDVDRQWIVTAYSLSFGSLLLFGGRLADLVGRRVMFITGLAGFAIASAIGGASVNFTMLVSARAAQGVFGAMLAPAALSLLATTFTDPKERGKAFGIYGSVAAGGGAVGLLLGGVLTSYLSWRWCLYINLFFAALAIAGAVAFLHGRQEPRSAQLDIPGVLLVSSGVFCLVYGFSNAATHSWGTPVDVRVPGRRGGAAGRVRLVDGPRRSTRCCRRGWSSTATGAPRTSASCWRARACSASSSSSPTTCRTRCTTRR